MVTAALFVEADDGAGVDFGGLIKTKTVERNHAGFRRITEASFGAALILHNQPRTVLIVAQWQRDRQWRGVDGDITKELIMIRLALLQLIVAECDFVCTDADAILIQVVAVFDLPIEIDLIALLEIAERKGFIHGHKLVVTAERERVIVTKRRQCRLAQSGTHQQ